MNPISETDYLNSKGIADYATSKLLTKEAQVLSDDEKLQVRTNIGILESSNGQAAYFYVNSGVPNFDTTAKTLTFPAYGRIFAAFNNRPAITDKGCACGCACKAYQRH